MSDILLDDADNGEYSVRVSISNTELVFFFFYLLNFRYI